jgi:hypothetical protein
MALLTVAPLTVPPLPIYGRRLAASPAGRYAGPSTTPPQGVITRELRWGAAKP